MDKLTIDRGRSRFNPRVFIAPNWFIWGTETDARLTRITELDITKIQLMTVLRGDEFCISGEERLRRLKKTKKILLDADIFLTLLENQHLIPDSWKEKVARETPFIYFDGTILRDPNGYLRVLCLCWRRGAWHFDAGWLGFSWHAYDLSAVLAP